MAQIGGDSNGRSSTIDLNLTPFIDLMCVCIIFLLVTAVWTQVSMIQIGSSIYGKKNTADQTPPPPRAEIPFRVDVRREGFRVIVGRQNLSVPKSGDAYDQPRLISELRKIKELYPDKNDAVITVLDELPYDSLIVGMDALLNSGFGEISVATAAAE